VLLGRNRMVVITRRIFFPVFIVKDNFVIIDNYYGIAVTPLFFVKYIQYPLLCFFAQLGPGYLVFTTKDIPLGPMNHCALFRLHSWFLVEPIVTLFSILVAEVFYPNLTCVLLEWLEDLLHLRNCLLDHFQHQGLSGHLHFSCHDHDFVPRTYHMVGLPG